MGILDMLGMGQSISKPIEAVGNLYTTDKARIEATKDLIGVANQVTTAQLENNRISLNSPNFFNSGWPALTGWTVGFLVLLYYAPQLAIITYVWGFKCLHTGIITPFPMKPDDILNLVHILFGFGVYNLIREKIK